MRRTWIAAATGSGSPRSVSAFERWRNRVTACSATIRQCRRAACDPRTPARRRDLPSRLRARRAAPPRWHTGRAGRAAGAHAAAAAGVDHQQDLEMLGLAVFARGQRAAACRGFPVDARQRVAAHNRAAAGVPRQYRAAVAAFHRPILRARPCTARQAVRRHGELASCCRSRVHQASATGLTTCAGTSPKRPAPSRNGRSSPDHAILRRPAA